MEIIKFMSEGKLLSKCETFPCFFYVTKETPFTVPLNSTTYGVALSDTTKNGNSHVEENDYFVSLPHTNILSNGYMAIFTRIGYIGLPIGSGGIEALGRVRVDNCVSYTPLLNQSLYGQPDCISKHFRSRIKTPLYFHQSPLFGAVLKGRADVHCGFDSYSLEEGDCYLIEANEEYKVVTGELDMVTIQFSPSKIT